MQKPTVLLQYNRNGLTEEEHRGFIVHCTEEKIIHSSGNTDNEPFYLRSCAKPLQASVIIDYELNFTQEEIALACGSNAGEKCHENIARRLADKIGVKETDIKCGIHKPLSKTRQAEMILTGEKENLFQNNCIGKHLTMLALCKKFDFDIKNYDKSEHPIQQIIKNKVSSLCRITGEYPAAKDGCGVPIFSMPLENMVWGFLNMFCDKKYSLIKRSILENPYIFGGEDRTDTKIIKETGLLAKVGAGGLCIVINTDIREGFVVKISDCDMNAREIVTFDYIKKLGWGNYASDKTIKTLHGETVGEIVTLNL